MMVATYTCWPVFVIPLNLPLGVCFQRQNILLSLIIPGHPGNNMGVFMEPLIDELVRAWEEGVWTYDRATKTNFKIHVWYQYSLMTCWCMEYSTPGVFTGSIHAQYARKVLGSFGCRRVASIRRSINIGNSSLLIMHSDETSKTL
jgi:hypothetical protein